MKLYDKNPYTIQLKLDHVYVVHEFQGCVRCVFVVNCISDNYCSLRVLEQEPVYLPEHAYIKQSTIVSKKDEYYNRATDVVGRCLGHKSKCLELFI